MTSSVGIDFGTTNSYIAVMEQDGPTVVPTPEGAAAMPAFVSVAENGRCLVSETARSMAIANAERTVYGVKRLLGRPASSVVVKSIAGKVPFRLAKDTDGELFIRLPQWKARPSEICGLILTEQRRLAKSYLEHEVSDAMVTVPTYFGEQQTGALIESARNAGFGQVATLDEPTAAVHAHGYEQRAGKTVAVYHLGGSTFEVTVLSIGHLATEVVCSLGDSFIGGEEIDQRVVGWFNACCQGLYGIDLSGNTAVLQRLRAPAEQAKRELDRREKTEMQILFLPEGSDHELDLRFALGREDLDQMARPLLLKTLETCQRMLVQANLTVDQIDEVLLIGGQTRMQLVQDLVADLFRRPPTVAEAPEETVALGACIAGNWRDSDEPLELAY
jgi:molecular chaperone DnaK